MKLRLVCFLIFVLAFVSAASAQTEPPDDSSHDAATGKSEGRVGKYEILTNSGGGFYFVLKSSNGQVIVTGFSHKSREAVLEKIEQVRQRAADDANFDARETDSKFSFVLKGADGKAIAMSESYSSSAAMKKGIESVKKNAPVAALKQ